MEKIIIAAINEKGIIGKDGKLPWHISEDLKRFKRLTSYHPIVMGRKTADGFSKPLPNRQNIILTRNKDYSREGFYTTDLDYLRDFFENPNNLLSNIDYSKLYIIGGAQIYYQTFDLADRLEITQVHNSIEGDTFFPREISENQWKEIFKEKHEGFTFLTYIRK